MPRVVIDPAVPDGKVLDKEIARLRGLDLEELQARWHTAFRRRAPSHLPRHLLFRILAYRLQADRLGELDADSRRLLDRIGSRASDEIDRLAADFNRTRTELNPGTLLTREWEGHPHAWVEEFTAELLAFPGRHDDQVDALTQGLAWGRVRRGEVSWRHIRGLG
jgi:hypothetical protein